MTNEEIGATWAGVAKGINSMARGMRISLKYGIGVPVNKIARIEDDPWMTDEVKKIAIRAYVEGRKYDREEDE